MQNFIVLGIVPGTSIQITFTFWLWVTSVLLFVLSLPFLIALLKTFAHYTVIFAYAWDAEYWEAVA